MRSFCGNVRKFAAKLFKQDKMKRLHSALCAFLIGTALLTSCLTNSDDTVTYYSDMAITQFTLGTLNRYTHTTSSSTGNDTIVKTTLTGSTYSMTVDHIAQRVYNVKELPVGTDVKHVICSVSTKNGGVVALRSMVSDSLQWFSSTDSIDFSQPRVFRVYAIDGSGYRDYTVSLNVSTSTGISFGWQMEKTIAQPDTLVGKRLAVLADSVAIVPDDSIVGYTDEECYAISTDGKLKASTDGGLTWKEEELDDDESLLPVRGQAVCATWDYEPADHTHYVLMVGTPRQADEQKMRVWRKITSGAGQGRWVYMPFDDSNYYPLLRQEHLAMAYYDGVVLCVGGDGVMKQSVDQGVSWRNSSDYALPSTLTGTVSFMLADSQGNLWMLTNTGQLWRGNKSK